MGCLKMYEVPPEFTSIEQGVAPHFMDLLRARPRYRRSQMEYIRAYSAMIYLEEAAQTQFLAQFNVTGIQIQYSGKGRDFTMPKCVG